MKKIAAFFEKPVLRGITKEELLQNAAALRRTAGDRAVLRALHFVKENTRVERLMQALKDGNISSFLTIIKESGRSSAELLQNYYSPKAPEEQGITLACAIAEELLGESGAWRVHGGGFAGTTLNFVPDKLLSQFIETMEGTFGEHCCNVLDIRPEGAAVLRLE